MENVNFNHTPVMLHECIEGLNIKSNGIYLDGTLGGAGHSTEIAKRLKDGMLIGIDKDDVALSVSEFKLNGLCNHSLHKSDFKDYEKVLSELNVKHLDGVLLDLGVSSYQLDTAERGFSYRFDAPLDMRMDKTQAFTALDVVNEYSEKELLRVLYEYGEERFAKNIVRNIIATRKIKPIATTGELNKVIENSIPRKFWGKGSPSKQTFQAIRIEVNGELKGLYECILGMARKLNKGGRMAVITFHSLEDRIVKNAFKLLSSDCICDKSIPYCVCGHKKEVIQITHKPITASKEELEKNSRSASAKLRIIEKL
ncbi:MAG: 16S rRNA (cytosine(1402)-N(4))-methyltransferase RsmH [Clostridia bacterium]|nr:16S rRNA (cytosine(1402)-N(4))-methyltransferase RsmH [Clostridia bacterium]